MAERTLKLNDENISKLEEYINADEEAGQFFNELGLITDEELAAGIHQDEDFRVRVELDPAFAATKVKELEQTGQIEEMRHT